MMINSGVSEEKVLNSFENISLQTNENAPNIPKESQRGVEDLLGQPSGKFNYKVLYTKPPSFDIPIESIVPEGQGDYFDDGNILSKKETYTVNVGKDEKKDRTMAIKELLCQQPEEELP